MILVPELTTTHLTLKPLGLEDYDYLLSLHDQNKRTTQDDTEDIQTPEEWRQYFNDLLYSNMTGWTVWHTTTEIRFGALYVTFLSPGINANINPVSDIRAIKDVQPMNGDGKLHVMDEAAHAAIPYLIGRFQLQRIGGLFGSNNVPALKFCERIGLRREGVIRHGSRVRGQPVDLHIFGMLKSEVRS